MRFDVSERPYGALLFAREQNESDSPLWQQPGCFDGASGFNHQRRVAAVIERSAAQFPGIEVRAEDRHFVGLFVAANFSDDVFLFDGAADFVG